MKIKLNKKTKLFSIVLLIIGLVALISFVTVPLVKASQPRDYDSNSIIYGGAYSIRELNNKINNGTGKSYQSSKELKNFFNTLGIKQSDFERLSNGTVYKDGRVVVNRKVVFKNAHSSGRQYINGSTRDNRFPYPIYWRSTSISFASGSIPAYVLMNHDGTMAYAIIKSCGNAVKGVGVKEEPIPTYNLEIKKYSDLNGDGKRQVTEPFLQGFTFKVSGPNTEKTVKTDKTGKVVVKNLKKGKYTITEIEKNGWKPTTDKKQSVKIEDKDMTVLFGNQRIVVEKFTIVATKYEDSNGNGVLDENEALLEDWSIRLTGNDITREFKTNGEGEVNYRDLPAGTYQLSEERKTGWNNITPLVQTVTVDNNNPEAAVEFGNQKSPELVITASATTPTLTVTGPAEMILGTLAVLGLGSAGYLYRKSRKKYSESLHNVADKTIE